MEENKPKVAFFDDARRDKEFYSSHRLSLRSCTQCAAHTCLTLHVPTRLRSEITADEVSASPAELGANSWVNAHCHSERGIGTSTSNSDYSGDFVNWGMMMLFLNGGL